MAYMLMLVLMTMKLILTLKTFVSLVFLVWNYICLVSYADNMLYILLMLQECISNQLRSTFCERRMIINAVHITYFLVCSVFSARSADNVFWILLLLQECISNQLRNTFCWRRMITNAVHTMFFFHLTFFFCYVCAEYVFF